MNILFKYGSTVIIGAFVFMYAPQLLANRLNIPAAQEPAASETVSGQKHPAAVPEESPQAKAAQGSDQPGNGQEGEPLRLPQDNPPQAQSPEKANVSPQSGQQEDESVSMNSLASLGRKRTDLSGEPLEIPASAQDVNFVDGLWNFESTFRTPAGEELRADFYFNEKGRGIAGLTDSKNNLYLANAMAQIEDDVLRIMTSPYVNLKNEPVFNSQYIECKNGPAGAECAGTDGFVQWAGEKMLRDNTTLASGFKSSVKDKAAQLNEDKGTGRAQTGLGAGGTQGELTELSSEGAELAPDVLASGTKAQARAGSLDLKSLQGNWLYSRELARRDDGKTLALEFNFDGAGKGYSVIRDSDGKEFKASAQAELAGKDLIRIKTTEYSDGTRQGFYPTFMECRPGQPDLSCDVSNGWMRMNDGRLVAINEKADKKTSVADILMMDPVDNGQQPPTSRSSVDDLLSGMAEEATLAANAGEEKARRAPPVSSKHPGPKLTIPRSSTNLDFLEGRWRCNTGLVRTSDGQPIVVEFTFNKDGQGGAFIREKDGTVLRASARASMRKGELRINTSEFHTSKKKNYYYNKTYIQCRDKGSEALCDGENGGIHWSDVTFTRLK